jgi:hypothetical protein
MRTQINFIKNKGLFYLTSLGLLAAIVLSLFSPGIALAQPQSPTALTDSYIIVFKDDVNPQVKCPVSPRPTVCRPALFTSTRLRACQRWSPRRGWPRWRRTPGWPTWSRIWNAASAPKPCPPASSASLRIKIQDYYRW